MRRQFAPIHRFLTFLSTNSLGNSKQVGNEVMRWNGMVFCNNLLRGKFAFERKREEDRKIELESAAWPEDLSKKIPLDSHSCRKWSLICRCHVSCGDKGQPKGDNRPCNGYTQPSPTRSLVFPYRKMRGWVAFPFCGRLQRKKKKKKKRKSRTSNVGERSDRIRKIKLAAYLAAARRQTIGGIRSRACKGETEAT